jgi:hypothetical protein
VRIAIALVLLVAAAQTAAAQTEPEGASKARRSQTTKNVERQAHEVSVERSATDAGGRRFILVRSKTVCQGGFGRDLAPSFLLTDERRAGHSSP